MRDTDRGSSVAPQLGEFDRILAVLRSRRNLILFVTLLVTLSALAFSLTRQKVYSASAGLLFRDPQLDQKLFGSSSLPPSTDPSREAATNVSLVGLKAISRRTAAALGGSATPGLVSARISVSATGESNIVQVTATDPNPTFAARLANTYAQQFIAFRRDADRAKIGDAQRLAQTQLSQLEKQGQAGSANGASLQDRVNQLGILASLQTGNAELVEPAETPTSPSSPKPKRNAVLGFILGLLMGVAAALLLERLDRRIKDTREIEEIYGLPILCEVAENQDLARGHAGEDHGFEVNEAFSMLRTRLRYFNVDREIRSLIVTSAGPAEGKTTVAENLAAAAARTGSARVLLLEADLRRPSFGGNFALASGPGLAEILSHGIGLDEVVQRMTLKSGDGIRAEKTIDVIVAGMSPPNPAELLESGKMGDLLEHLTAIYDLVIIDTPPAGAISDAIPLMTRVGGVVIVSAVGTSSRDAAAHFREQLKQLGVPLLGVVVNRVKQSRTVTYYGGGYQPLTSEAAGPLAGSNAQKRPPPR